MTDDRDERERVLASQCFRPVAVAYATAAALYVLAGATLFDESLAITVVLGLGVLHMAIGIAALRWGPKRVAALRSESPPGWSSLAVATVPAAVIAYAAFGIASAAVFLSVSAILAFLTRRAHRRFRRQAFGLD